MGIKQLRQSGFTVVELVVVIAVIAILAAIVIVGYGAWRNQTGENALKSDLTALAGAMESARNFGNVYPSSTPSGFTASSNIQSVTINTTSTGDYYCASAVSTQNTSTTFRVTSEDQTPKSGTCTNYTGVTVGKGLIGWWKLNGNATDSTGSGNNGTVSGAVPGVGQDGSSNNGYSFDGVDDYISIPQQIPNPLNGATVSIWARVVAGTGGDSANRAYIFHRSASFSLGDSIFAIVLEPGTPKPISGSFGGNYVAGITSATESASTWRFIATTFDGTRQKVYVDGVLLSNTAINPITNNVSGNTTTLGGSALNPTFRPIVGNLDDARIYNRPLSQADITALYNAGAQ